MIENELKRIADALEAIAIAMQPVRTERETEARETDPTPDKPYQPTPSTPTKRGKYQKPAEKPVPVLPEAEDVTPEYNTDDIVSLVQKAVKVNRDATLEVCRKYGYIKTLKDIQPDKYVELAKELEGVK